MKMENGNLRAVIAVLLIAVVPCAATAQTLNFSNHREVSIPEYAVLRIGPFYSSVTFSQSAGYRYSNGDGNGVDYLFNNQRGVFLKDGSDFPLVSTLDMRNYLMITRTADLDISLRASYEHYPMKTQKDELFLDTAEEGLVGSLSTEFSLTPYVKGTAYDDMRYRTDYVDKRGLNDRYGGQIYKYFRNTAGLDLDWLMAKDQNLSLKLSRADMLPSSEAFNDQEGFSYSETLAYQTMLNQLVMVGASAAFSQYTYTAATNRPDSSFQTFSVFSTLKLTERTVASAAVGYSKVSSPFASGGVAGRSGEAGDNGGMVGSLSLNTELARGLKHQLEYSRSLNAGFNTSSELRERYGYRLDWNDEGLMTAGLFSHYNKVASGDLRFGDYTDWISGINASLLITSIITLTFDTTYSVRENNNVSEVPVSAPELANNYNTLSSRIGTSFAVIQDKRDSVVFSTYLQHIDRSSDFTDIAYSRDVFAAVFIYTHKF